MYKNNKDIRSKKMKGNEDSKEYKRGGGRIHQMSEGVGIVTSD
jgi:hypothetical protein